MPSCPIRDCTRPSRSPQKGGLCARHGHNLRVHGHAIPLRDMTVEEALEHVGFTRTETGCLEWNGPVNEHGYGRLNLVRQGLVDARVHRVVWKLRVGPLDDDTKLRHTCDNPPCSELTHLVPGTQADNIDDMMQRGRHWRSHRTVCDNDHEITTPGPCETCRKDRVRRDNVARREQRNAWARARRRSATVTTSP